MPFTPENFIEELQVAIADGSDLDLVCDPDAGSVNFVIAEFLDLDDLSSIAGAEIICAMHEEGGSLKRSARRDRQERSIRFVTKADGGQASINLGLQLLKFLERTLSFATSTFTIWVARFDSFPTVIGRDQSGSSLASFVATFFVWHRGG